MITITVNSSLISCLNSHVLLMPRSFKYTKCETELFFDIVKILSLFHVQQTCKIILIFELYLFFFTVLSVFIWTQTPCYGTGHFIGKSMYESICTEHDR